MTLASQIYDPGMIKTITSPMLDVSIFEEIESYESDGTAENRVLLYISFNALFNDVTTVYKAVYLEYLFYIFYLDEIPDDALDILDSFITDQSLTNFYSIESSGYNIKEVTRDFNIVKKYLSAYGNGLLFVGWLKIDLLRHTQFTAAFLKQEET